MIAFYTDKIDYTYQCNKMLIDMILEHPTSYTEHAAMLIGHTINTQNIWTTRILGAKNTQDVWQTFTLNELHEVNETNYRLSLKIVETQDISSVLEYVDLAGRKFKNNINDMLFHMINHATYHRGQLISEIKKHGAKVTGTDFINFKR